MDSSDLFDVSPLQPVFDPAPVLTGRQLRKANRCLRARRRAIAQQLSSYTSTADIHELEAIMERQAEDDPDLLDAVQALRGKEFGTGGHNYVGRV